MDKRTDGWTDGNRRTEMDGRKWMDGRTDGRVDRRTEMDGRTDERFVEAIVYMLKRKATGKMILLLLL